MDRATHETTAPPCESQSTALARLARRGCVLINGYCLRLPLVALCYAAELTDTLRVKLEPLKETSDPSQQEKLDYICQVSPCHLQVEESWTV